MTEHIKPKVIHLMINKECDHNCPLCCNKFYNIDDIPVATVEELNTVETVCITGGEPFMAHIDINRLAGSIRKQYPNVINIFVYTSGNILIKRYSMSLKNFSGVNIAPKNKKDWEAINDYLGDKLFKGHPLLSSLRELKMNRLYVFKDQVDNFEKYKYIAKDYNLEVVYRKWDNEFKTPEDEIFRRLPIFL